MKIITRYLLKELMGPFFFGVLIFSGMFLGSSLVNLIQWLERYQVHFWSVLKLWILTIPENMAYGVYIGILLATLIGLGRMTSHSETIAMQAGGASFLQIATPVLLLGLLVSCVSFLLNETIAPAAKLAYRQEWTYLTQDKPKGVVEEYFYNEKGKNDFQRLIYAEKYYVAEERFINVVIQEFQKGNLIRTIKSKELLWGKEGWYFKEGEIFYYREDSVVPVRVTEGYNPSGLTKTPAQVRKVAQRPEEMSWWDLRWYLKNTELNVKNRRRLESQLHLKTAFPFACFIFALLGTPLALQSQRRTASAGLGICLINVIFYYLLMSLGTYLANTGITSPWVGAWLQNIVLGLFGGYLFLKKALYLS